MGVMLSAAASLKWWVEDVNNEADYAAVNTQAEKVAPGSDGLYFLPYLMGERTPHNDPAARGAFIGLTAQHTRGHLTRAIMEGVSYALNDSLIILKDMGICLKKVRISGGGAKSRLWKKIIADVFNTCVCSINATEGPAFGAAILAAVGCGAYKDVASACNAIVNDTDVVTPDSKSVARYKKGYDIFKSLYPTLKDTFRVLRSDG
jgi:xylulokinase